MKQGTGRYSLADLAERCGIPARTIRFYIARGLLPGPVKGGRSAEYGTEHLDRLDKIQGLQQDGLTLVEIADRLSGRTAARLPEPRVWMEYQLAEDVVVRVRSGVSPWRQRQITNWLAQMPGVQMADERKPNE